MANGNGIRWSWLGPVLGMAVVMLVVYTHGQAQARIERVEDKAATHVVGQDLQDLNVAVQELHDTVSKLPPSFPPEQYKTFMDAKFLSLENHIEKMILDMGKHIDSLAALIAELHEIRIIS